MLLQNHSLVPGLVMVRSLAVLGVVRAQEVVPKEVVQEEVGPLGGVAEVQRLVALVTGLVPQEASAN